MAEKRRSHRLPIQLAVSLVARGSTRATCVMRDVCTSGALLDAVQGLPDGLIRGAPLQLVMRLGNDPESGMHRLNARVARVSGTQIGVAFYEPADATVALLMSRATQPTPPANPPEPSSAQTEAILSALGDQVIAYCEARLPCCLSEAEQDLFNTANQARSNTEQSTLFEAMTRVRAEKSAIETRVLAALLSRLTRDEARNPTRQAGSIDLALVSKQELDDWLIIRIMSNAQESLCIEELSALRQRLRALTGKAPGAHGIFSPWSICDAFQSVVNTLGLSAAAQRPLYKALESCVLGELNVLYSSLNEQLISKGVLPVLPRVMPTAGGTASRPAASAPPASRPAPAVQPVPEIPAPVPQLAPAAEDDGAATTLLAGIDTRVAMNAVARLLQGGLTLAPASTPQRTTLPQRALIDVLPELKAAGRGWRVRLQELSQGVEWADDFRLQSGLRMSASLLDKLLHFPQLGDSARQWFRQLELVLLYGLVVEDDLLQASGSIARQVFNSLAQLGYAGYPLPRESEIEISALVARIAQEFDLHNDVFPVVRDRLAPHLARQQRVLRRNQERVVRVAETEHALESARRTVDSSLDALFSNRKLPQPVHDLIDMGWRDHLIHVCQRQGAGSTDWKVGIRLLQMLLSGEHVGRRAGVLLKQLATGLGDAQGNLSTERKEVLEQIRVMLGSPATSPVLLPWQDNASRSPEPAPMRGVERARRLQRGDWLELGSGGPSPERMRLAWQADDGERFVFVNHLGIKVADWRLYQLAECLLKEDTLVQAGPETAIMDQALDSVVHGLYDHQAWHSTHDELTGLINRHEFTRRLDRAIDSARVKGRLHSLACINVDQFKLVNTTLGFAAGDQFLREIAELLSRRLPDGCALARLGGDKFGLVLESIEIDQARMLLRARLDELAGKPLTSQAGQQVLTASVGLVLVSGDVDAAQMLGLAEESCARARVEGGNRIHVPRQETAHHKRERARNWLARLNQPLDPAQLRLRCQRILPIASERRDDPAHYEVLLGLPEATAPEQSPGEFLEMAERYHRMTQVDQWVVNGTLGWLESEASRLDHIGVISINLSGHTLSDTGMMNTLLLRLRNLNFPLEKLCFEITEQVAIASLADTADFMREVKKLGCRFALDDFGVGHATYHYIKHLPLDYLKIDGSFVKDIATNANDLVMVRSINDLAHFMGIKTIAEYVENDAILAKLADIGVDYAQGYGIERPRWLNTLISA